VKGRQDHGQLDPEPDSHRDARRDRASLRRRRDGEQGEERHAGVGVAVVGGVDDRERIQPVAREDRVAVARRPQEPQQQERVAEIQDGEGGAQQNREWDLRGAREHPQQRDRLPDEGRVIEDLLPFVVPDESLLARPARVAEPDGHVVGAFGEDRQPDAERRPEAEHEPQPGAGLHQSPPNAGKVDHSFSSSGGRRRRQSHVPPTQRSVMALVAMPALKNLGR
jgi:hypothetical protein